MGSLHLRPVRLSSLVFRLYQFSILIMTCAGKRGRQLSSGPPSAMRIFAFCSAVIHVITLMWALRNHFHISTNLDHRIVM